MQHVFRECRAVPCGAFSIACVGLESLDSVVEPETGATASVGAKTLAARTRARRVVAGALATALLFVPALLAGFAVQRDPPSTAVSSTSVAAPPSSPTVQLPPVEPLPESLPADALGIVPSTIWLADRGPGWELYSNGLRIETTYAVTGEPRIYRVHDRAGGLQPTVYTQPVGILFHTSESDLWPLEAGLRKELRRSSAALLQYVQQHAGL